MTQIETIIAEIERLKIEKRKENLPFHALYYDGYAAACDKIIAYLNSLPTEQPSGDLEKEIDRFQKAKYGGDMISVTSIAWHFAIWQKEQMLKGFCYETKVYRDEEGDGIDTPIESWLALENNEITNLPNIGLKEGDKVKILIIK